jgi:hypothetical protein
MKTIVENEQATLVRIKSINSRHCSFPRMIENLYTKVVKTFFFRSFFLLAKYIKVIYDETPIISYNAQKYCMHISQEKKNTYI